MKCLLEKPRVFIVKLLPFYRTSFWRARQPLCRPGAILVLVLDSLDHHVFCLASWSCGRAGWHAVTLRTNGSAGSFPREKAAKDATSLDQQDVVVSRVPCRAGRSPILRFCDDRATNRICVNGLDFRVNGLGFVQIPIVTPPALPERMLKARPGSASALLTGATSANA
jgi:hypothetical protein